MPNDPTPTATSAEGTTPGEQYEYEFEDEYAVIATKRYTDGDGLPAIETRSQRHLSTLAQAHDAADLLAEGGYVSARIMLRGVSAWMYVG